MAEVVRCVRAGHSEENDMEDKKVWGAKTAGPSGGHQVQIVVVVGVSRFLAVFLLGRNMGRREDRHACRTDLARSRWPVRPDMWSNLLALRPRRSGMLDPFTCTVKTRRCVCTLAEKSYGGLLASKLHNCNDVVLTHRVYLGQTPSNCKCPFDS